MGPGTNKKSDERVIHIDRNQYKVAAGEMTGEQLRALPTPPIGENLDLFLEQPGDVDDRLVGRHDVIKLKNGMHFFTAPTTIAPGRAA